MNVIGIECGVGSMLIPSKELGFNIVGNLESRKCFFTGTFEENFNAGLLSGVKSVKDIDILFSHPKCGEFSSLNSGKKAVKWHGGFLSIIESINIIKPKFFIIDNLPKSLEYYSLTWWTSQLEDYDVTVEFVSNHGYGNTQKNRNRLFIIGSLKKFEFVFIPNEERHNLKLRHVIKGVENKHNHDLFPDSMKAPGFSPYTIEETRLLIQNIRFDKTVFYKKEGNKTVYSGKKHKKYKQRIGTLILNSNQNSPTITSNLGLYLKDNKRPLTCRERARIQGCPDWFKFVLDDKQMFSQTMGDQTGKFIPVEFIRYITNFINNFLNGGKIEATGKRLEKDYNVFMNKRDNCRKFGHSNMRELCNFCNFTNCRVRQHE